MRQEAPGDSHYPQPLPSSDEHTDKETTWLANSVDGSEVTHDTVGRCVIHAQRQRLTSLQPPSPRLPTVTVQHHQGDSLAIRPFPLQDFLDSHELSVLLSILDPSNDGMSLNYTSIFLHQLTFFHFLASSQRPKTFRRPILFRLISKVVISYTFYPVLTLTYTPR